MNPVDRAAIIQWFRWIGRAEGISLLLLWGIGMPLKYGASILEPVAWFGWAHGVLFVLYVIALRSAGRVLCWTWSEAMIAFICSLLPGGTFWFERRLA